MSKQWGGSLVWADFAKIAAESGFIGSDLTPKQNDYVENRKKEVPTGDDYTREPKTEEYDVTKETGKDLIEKAHKDDAQMASAMGKGGLVENILQQQEKDIEVALKMPNGTLHGVHAELVSDLVKLANQLDESGNTEAAARVDAAIKELTLPFVNGHLRKESFAPFAFMLAHPILAGTLALFGAGTVGLQSAFSWFSSMREGMGTDAQDLLEVLEKTSEESPSAQKAANLLSPFISKFNNINFTDEKDIIKFKETLREFEPVLAKIQFLVNAIELEKGESRWFYFGVDLVSRIKSHIADLVKSVNETKKKLAIIEGKGQEQIEKQQTEKGQTKTFMNYVVGDELDPQSIEYLKKMETDLTSSLSSQIQDSNGKPYNLVGKFVDNNKLAMEPTTIARIIELTNKLK